MSLVFYFLFAPGSKIPRKRIFCNHYVALIASGAQGVYLSKPLPHLVLSPLPVGSLDFNAQ